MTIDKKNFCMAPFREAVIETNGTLLPCCEFKYPAPKYQSQETFGEFDQWWTEDMGHLREQMLTTNPMQVAIIARAKNRYPARVICVIP